MSEYEALREDLRSVMDSVRSYAGAVTRHALASDSQVEKLWEGQAELRDEINAVANRVESLTRAVMADPAEVAAAWMHGGVSQKIDEFTRAVKDAEEKS